LSFFSWPLFVLFLLTIVCPFSLGHCLSFFSWPLYCLSIFKLQYLTPLVSTNFSYSITTCMVSMPTN
jgi:hypothetical protein